MFAVQNAMKKLRHREINVGEFKTELGMDVTELDEKIKSRFKVINKTKLQLEAEIVRLEIMDCFNDYKKMFQTDSTFLEICNDSEMKYWKLTQETLDVEIAYYESMRIQIGSERDKFYYAISEQIKAKLKLLEELEKDLQKDSEFLQKLKVKNEN